MTYIPILAQINKEILPIIKNFIYEKITYL